MVFSHAAWPDAHERLAIAPAEEAATNFAVGLHAHSRQPCFAQMHGHVVVGDTSAAGGINQEGCSVVDPQAQLVPSVTETLEVGVAGWALQGHSRQLRRRVTRRKERF